MTKAIDVAEREIHRFQFAADLLEMLLDGVPAARAAFLCQTNGAFRIVARFETDIWAWRPPFKALHAIFPKCRTQIKGSARGDDEQPGKRQKNRPVRLRRIGFGDSLFVARKESFPLALL